MSGTVANKTKSLPSGVYILVKGKRNETNKQYVGDGKCLGGEGRNNAIVIRVWTLFYSVLDPGCLEQCLAHSRCSIKCLKQNRRK